MPIQKERIRAVSALASTWMRLPAWSLGLALGRLHHRSTTRVSPPSLGKSPQHPVRRALCRLCSFQLSPPHSPFEPPCSPSLCPGAFQKCEWKQKGHGDWPGESPGVSTGKVTEQALEPRLLLFGHFTGHPRHRKDQKASLNRCGGGTPLLLLGHLITGQGKCGEGAAER